MADFIWLSLLFCTCVASLTLLAALIEGKITMAMVALAFTIAGGYATHGAYELAHPPQPPAKIIAS